MRDRASTTRMTVTCFGELLIRLMPPGKQLLAQSDTLIGSVGGAEANVAMTLAWLGREVRFCGIVSETPLGERALAGLRRAGVGTSHLARARGRMGLYFMEEGAGPRPSAICYDRAGSAFAEATPVDIDFSGALAGAKLFHAGGITPGLGPKGIDLARAANDAAKAAAVPISFDCNYRPSLWKAAGSDPAPILRELVADATVLFANHQDIALLLGRVFAGEGPDRQREAAEAAFAAFPRLELIASTSRQIVTSDHHRLAVRVDSRSRAHQTDALDMTAIVDRIGAGDAFAAGVIDGWLEGGELDTMAERGLALFALKHTLAGDNAPITRAMIEHFSAIGGDVRR